MSESTPPPAPEAATAAAAGPVPAPVPAPGKVLPILAAVFAGLGFIMAFAAAGVAWLPCLAAIVLAIIALVRKSALKGLSIAALIVAPIAWLIAIIVAVATVATSVSDAIDQIDDAPSAASHPDAVGEDDPDGPREAGIGDTVTNDDGIAFTVTSIECGLATAGDNEFLQEKANGQFCEVAFTLENGSDDAVNVSTVDITGSIGNATYEPNTAASRFGDDYFSTDINPGLSADCVVYIDIPKDKSLEYVTYSPLFSFGGDVVVAVS